MDALSLVPSDDGEWYPLRCLVLAKMLETEEKPVAMSRHLTLLEPGSPEYDTEWFAEFVRMYYGFTAPVDFTGEPLEYLEKKQPGEIRAFKELEEMLEDEDAPFTLE